MSATVSNPGHDRVGRRLVAGAPRGTAGALLALVIVLLSAANAFYPVVIVRPQPVASLVYGLVVVGGTVTAIILVWGRGLIRVAVVSVLAVVMLMLALLVGAAVLLFRGEEEIGRQDVPGWGVVVTYRTNGGATTDFGRRVQRECQLVPGVYLVRVLSRSAHEPAG